MKRDIFLLPDDGKNEYRYTKPPAGFTLGKKRRRRGVNGNHKARML